MSVAILASDQSTCARRNVGAVIVDADNHIIGTGYSGSARGADHCIENYCAGAGMTSGTGLEKCEAIHAEQNAIAHCSDIKAARTIYTTTAPCDSCLKLLLATNINRIVYLEFYPTFNPGRWMNTGRTVTKLVVDNARIKALHHDDT